MESIKSGYWNRDEGRALVRLYTSNEKPLIVSAINNKGVITHQKNTIDDWCLSIEPNEYTGLITFKDKSKQRIEFYYGEGYLSQNSRRFCINSKLVKQIEISTYQGEKRTLKPFNDEPTK